MLDRNIPVMRKKGNKRRKEEKQEIWEELRKLAGKMGRRE